MVPGYPDLEAICANCQGYEFRPGNTEWGQAYCIKKVQWFPNQREGKPAGMRSCKNWERKTIYHEEIE